MKSNNYLMLEGRLTRDLEVRQGKEGYVFGTTAIAVNDGYRNNNGEWVNRDTMFVDVLVQGEKANYLKDVFKKGRAVNLRGELRVSNYIGKDNQKRQSISIKVDSQSLVEVVKRNKGQAQQSQQYNESEAFVKDSIEQQYNPTDFQAIDGDEEIPF